jgi:hypothetical protein
MKSRLFGIISATSGIVSAITLYGSYVNATTSPSNNVISLTFNNKKDFVNWITNVYNPTNMTFDPSISNTIKCLIGYNLYDDVVYRTQVSGINNSHVVIEAPFITNPNGKSKEFHTFKSMKLLLSDSEEQNTIINKEILINNTHDMGFKNIDITYREGLRSRYIVPITNKIAEWIDKIKKSRPPPPRPPTNVLFEIFNKQSQYAYN